MKYLIIFLFVGITSLSESVPSPYPFRHLRFFPKMPLSKDNPVTIEGATLGRFLFYDPILSLDSSISCASCHQQAAAFSDAPKAFSLGIQKTEGQRNTPPLFNLAWYESMFWDGRAINIEEQVFHPVRAHEEMRLEWHLATQRIQASSFYKPLFEAAFGKMTIDSLQIAKAIAQFERTLISNNSKYDKVLRNEAYFTTDELAGFVLVNEMNKGDCLQCHTTDADALGTTGKFSNNGLEAIFDPLDYLDQGLGKTTGKTSDNGKFKIPSLRNIALTAPYMHDGRFSSLEEVVAFYNNDLHLSANVDPRMGAAQRKGVHLSSKEQAQIVAFLHTLTDSTFITNPEFSNPF